MSPLTALSWPERKTKSLIAGQLGVGKMRIFCALLVVLLLLANPEVTFGFNSLMPTRHAHRLTSKSTTTLWTTPAPLAEEGNWQAFLDEETTGLIYYFDVTTGDSLWEPPTDTFPTVRLSRKKQRLADDLRRKYRETRQAAESFSAVEATTSQEKSKKAEKPREEKRAKKEEKQPVLIESESAPAVKEVMQPAVEDTQFEEEEAVESPEKAARTDWFGGIFGKSEVGEDSTEIADDQVEEDFEDAVSPKGPSFLDSLFAAPAKKEKIVVEPDLTPQPIKIEIGSHVSPHPAKMLWGGEDAVFSKGRTFGVFDGVSGAEKLDGVPLYSKTLAREMKKMIGKDGLSISEMTLFLTEAAEYADEKATGASTALVGSIGENGFLQVLNVGDSAAMVIRNGRVSAKTRELSHYWECPYQLSEDSPDRPKDGTKLNVELIAGDVIVMGSDGIFDNLSDDEILDVVESSPKRSSALAKKLVDLSRKRSLDPNAKTPYARQAQRRGDQDFKDGVGGKVDDASCVVVFCK